MDRPSQIDGLHEDQSTLTFSVTNRLILVRPPTPGWRKALRPPSRSSKGIMRLPDELLQDIIYRVVPRHSFYNPAGRPDHYAPYVALTKTCRRFHRLATPMMYSGLNICIGSESISPYFDKYPVEVMRKLLRSFEENSHLGEFCERLNIMLRHERRLELDHWDDPEMPEFPLAADAEVEVEMITALAALLTGTKSVEIIGDIHRYKEIWTILRTASANMPRLETVRLNEYGGAAYGPICDSVSRAGTLKCLDVSLVGETTGASQAITKNYPMYIENMYINNFRDGPENLRRLVSWPQTVEHLVLESGFLSSEDLHASWGLRELTPVIACQKENLRTLVIGRVPCDGMGLSGFSITDFPNLEELRLSRWSTGSLVAEQANLLAPQLRKFIWCFDFGGDIDGMGCDISDFGEWEENWLWNLMKTAVKQKACLSHVHLYFCPEPKWHSELSGIVFPWDRIDALREEFRHAGIKVTCQSDPKWYKHLWDRTRPGYKIPDSPPQTPPPAPDAHLPDPETDSESLVSLDGENQANKITLYFRPLPLRRRSW